MCPAKSSSVVLPESSFPNKNLFFISRPISSFIDSSTCDASLAPSCGVARQASKIWPSLRFIASPYILPSAQHNPLWIVVLVATQSCDTVNVHTPEVNAFMIVLLEIELVIQPSIILLGIRRSQWFQNKTGQRHFFYPFYVFLSLLTTPCCILCVLSLLCSLKKWPSLINYSLPFFI